MRKGFLKAHHVHELPILILDHLWVMLIERGEHLPMLKAAGLGLRLDVRPGIAGSLSFAIARGIKGDAAAARGLRRDHIAGVLVGIRTALWAFHVERARHERKVLKDRRLLLLFFDDCLLCAVRFVRRATGSEISRRAGEFGARKELDAFVGVQLRPIGKPIVFAERRRVGHHKDLAAGNTRLKAAFAIFAHLLELEASALDTAAEVMHRHEFHNHAKVALILVVRRAPLPIFARRCDEFADSNGGWLREGRPHAAEDRGLLGLGLLRFAHWTSDTRASVTGLA
eukprot:5643152-Prymnesium_polylepis.2